MTGLAQRVSQRLAALDELTAARGKQAQVRARANARQEALGAQTVQSQRAIAEAIEAAAAAPSAWAKDHASFIAALKSAAASDGLASLDDGDLRAASSAATLHADRLQETSGSFTSVQTVYARYRTAMDNQKTLDRVAPRLKRALEICEEQRRSYLDGVLVGIATEVGRLYEAIHPGEGLSKISLKLDPKKTGSLDLGAEFMAKQDQPPHAYFSESHLDSLGLCIFLALAGRQDPKQTILVMDDVLGSIDEPHVDRLVEMLYDEAKKFKHTIITTHYRPWREKFRWGQLRSGECELIELGVWDAHTGIASARLREPTFTVAEGERVRDYRETVEEPARIKQMLFGGFAKCLYPIQKFDSDTERRFSVALERGANKWFKPAKAQFQIYYKLGAEHPEYVPDFAAETGQFFLMCETKKVSDMEATEVRAKAESGATWCRHATQSGSVKPWKYLLIPHEQVTADKRLEDYFRFEVRV